MTAAAATAGTLLSTRGLSAPEYPQPEAFSLQGMFRRLAMQIRIVLEPDAPQVLPIWIETVLPRFGELLSLRPNWDSYGGRPLTMENFEAALNVLGFVMGPGTPAPWIVPLPSGGVQLEWHGDDLEVEVVIDRENSGVVVTREGSVQEAPLGSALTLLATTLRRNADEAPAVPA